MCAGVHQMGYAARSARTRVTVTLSVLVDPSFHLGPDISVLFTQFASTRRRVKLQAPECASVSSLHSAPRYLDLLVTLLEREAKNPPNL